MQRLLKLTALFLLLMNVSVSVAQDNNNGDDAPPTGKLKHWKVGIYVGSYFANKYTASAYDGYGFDLNGNRNTFEYSYMNEKINNEYGGGYGYPDQIAAALNVNPRNSASPGWVAITEDDMPTNMHYTPSFMFGIEGRYSVDKRNAIEVNLNVAKVNSNGNFTITTTPPTGSTQVNNSIQTFGIRGVEQRLLLQLGFCHLVGQNPNVQLLLEGGINGTYAEFQKNEVLINSLRIDLTGFYDYQGIQANYTKKPRGFAMGAYGGIGMNLSMNDNYTVQLVYNPTYEGIKIVAQSRYKLQNAIALRAYYNF
ncbi:MAG: hypothetical protein ACXVPY_05325 [Bacteroidia bacterium]